MQIEKLRLQIPDYAKDIKLNLETILTLEGAPDLNQKQIYFIALCSAYSVKSEQLVDAILSEANDVLSEKEIKMAKAVAIIMAMNNIYYRFLHLTSDKSFEKMPAKLRMNIISNPEIDKIDFELGSLAVSALNGCGKCVDAHTNALLKSNISQLAIQSAIRIASVMNAAALSLTI